MMNMEIELSSSHSVKHVHLKVDSTLTIQFFLDGYFFLSHMELMLTFLLSHMKLVVYFQIQLK